jgi:hypothetical protein
VQTGIRVLAVPPARLWAAVADLVSVTVVATAPSAAVVAGLGAGLPIPARAASISSMTSHSRSSVWSVAGAGVVGSASNGGVVGSASDGKIVGVASDGEIVGFASDGEFVGVASDGEIVGVFRRQWGGWVIVSFLEARGARRKRSCSWRAASRAARAKTA